MANQSGSVWRSQKRRKPVFDKLDKMPQKKAALLFEATVAFPETTVVGDGRITGGRPARVFLVIVHCPALMF